MLVIRSVVQEIIGLNRSFDRYFLNDIDQRSVKGLRALKADNQAKSISIFNEGLQQTYRAIFKMDA